MSEKLEDLHESDLLVSEKLEDLHEELAKTLASYFLHKLNFVTVSKT